jgi:hypothetical protein
LAGADHQDGIYGRQASSQLALAEADHQVSNLRASADTESHALVVPCVAVCPGGAVAKDLLSQNTEAASIHSPFGPNSVARFYPALVEVVQLRLVAVPLPEVRA